MYFMCDLEVNVLNQIISISLHLSLSSMQQIIETLVSNFHSDV